MTTFLAQGLQAGGEWCAPMLPFAKPRAGSLSMTIFPIADPARTVASVGRNERQAQDATMSS